MALLFFSLFYLLLFYKHVIFLQAYTQTWTADVGDRTFRLKTTSIKRNTVIEVIDKNAKSRARFGKINPSERKDYKIMYTKDST